MTRPEATSLTKELLELHGLHDWRVHLTIDARSPFFGLCSTKDKRIILNAFHIDTHPGVEVEDTIKHEIAHALTPGHGHDEVWKEKAKELGAAPFACATYSLNAEAIDAIRSGQQIEISFEERTIREPKYKITRLLDKCKVCDKVAKTKTVKIIKTSGGFKKVVTLECLHMIITDTDSYSDFESFTFDGSKECTHTWGNGRARTVCQKCGAKRLYEYQIEGARALESANGRFALLDEQGLGKTIQALIYLAYHPEAVKYLWVTKSGIKYQHANEIIRLLGDSYFPQILTTGRDTLMAGVKGYLCSYDLFRRFPNLNMFKEAGVKTIILDECQAIKNPDSSRTQSVRKVVQELPKVIPMSGTFWKNRGSEAFVMLNMLDPKRFHSFEKFKNTQVETYWQGSKLKEGGLRKGFIDEIRDIAIRRERKDVMPELPLISRNKLSCEIPEHARKTYGEAEDKLVHDLNDAIIDGTEGSFATNQKIMESLIIMRQIVGIAKVPTTIEFAQEFLEETDRKLVIFVHHIQCGKLIADEMTKWCIENNEPQPLLLTASLASEERFEIQRKFNSPHYRLMIASTLASGEGLNLQTCSDCIMHERQWNPANEEQAEGRFIRIGQEATAVTATYVHASDSADTDLDGIVEGKRIQFHNSMNKGEIPVWNQDSIVMELAKRIAARRKLKGN